MAGRSWPNRALSASTPCPGGMLGALGAACACAPGLAAAGSDCSNGPFGATLPLGGMRLWAGGTDGTSSGGRSVNASGPWVLPKNCAFAVAASAASQTPAAKTSWPPLPSLVPPMLMAAVFDRNSGKFKPLAGVCHRCRPVLGAALADLCWRKCGYLSRRSRSHAARIKPMPDALELLKTRRSIKPIELAGPAPSAAEIETLLTVASRVPDHGKLVPWRFIIFEGAARLAAG